MDSQTRFPMMKWLLLTIIVIVLDLWSKSLISSSMQLYQSIPLIDGFFNFTLLHNYGAAFSFLADQPGWQRWFFTIISSVMSLVLLIWIMRLKADEKLLAIALAFVLGGAIGNLWDRVTLGYVVDFLDVFIVFNDKEQHWPAFNIADSAIFIGAVLLIIDTFSKPEEVKSA
ncbi:MAG: signal peptidase II [Gammaproteobacteria bacterium]|nr:signal peptidase II [Gammaproteobacteria bacterium]